MKNLKIEAWAMFDACGYKIINGNNELILNTGHIKQSALFDAAQLAILLNCPLILNAKEVDPQAVKMPTTCHESLYQKVKTISHEEK